MKKVTFQNKQTRQKVKVRANYKHAARDFQDLYGKEWVKKEEPKKR